LANSPTENSTRSLLVLFAVIIMDLIGFGIVLPILPYYAKSLDTPPATLGLLLAAYPAFQFVFSPIWGRLSDRVGRKPVMLATILGSAGALALLGISDSLLGLFAGRILGGVFGANISVATAYVADVTREEERTRWMGMVGACFAIGFVLGPALGGLLAPSLDGSWPASAVFGATLSAHIEPFGYGIPMLLAAVMAAINFVFASWALAEPDRQASREPSAGRLEILRNPAVRRLCIINLIFSLAVTQLETIFAYFMIDRFRFDAMHVAFILVGMAVLMGGVQGGAIRPLAARFGERRLALAGFALMGVSLLAVPFMPSVGWIMLPLALSSIGRGIGQPPILSMVSMTASASERGSVMGTFQSSASLASVLGPATAGALYALYQGGPFVLAAILMFVAWLIVIGLPKAHEHQRD
jgi:DHA1 family tetracycline resistance protein-like MFS transporter